TEALRHEPGDRGVIGKGTVDAKACGGRCPGEINPDCHTQTATRRCLAPGVPRRRRGQRSNRQWYNFGRNTIRKGLAKAAEDGVRQYAPTLICESLSGVIVYFTFSGGGDMRNMIFALVASMLPFCAALADEELPGTYKLISSTRTIVETGEVKDS